VFFLKELGMHMKSLTVVILMLTAVLIEPASAKMYSRALRERWIADSLHRIDSLRITDSLRKSDSLTVARYGQSDSILAAERMRQAADTTPPPVMFDTGANESSGEVDNISGRTIVIDPANPYARTVDSLQKTIDSLNAALHDGDIRYKVMKGNSISEKKRYVLFLLQNKMKDTAAVVAYCNAVFEILKVKQNLLFAIKDSQDPKTKNFIKLHIEKHRSKMADLSNFILALTPKLPSMPEKVPVKIITEQ